MTNVGGGCSNMRKMPHYVAATPVRACCRLVLTLRNLAPIGHLIRAQRRWIRVLRLATIETPIAIGELIDKITILQIKVETMWWSRCVCNHGTWRAWIWLFSSTQKTSVLSAD